MTRGKTDFTSAQFAQHQAGQLARYLLEQRLLTNASGKVQANLVKTHELTDVLVIDAKSAKNALGFSEVGGLGPLLAS